MPGVAAALLVPMMIGTACAAPPIAPTPVTHQVVLEFDVSRSTLPAVDDYAARAAAVLDQLPDGTQVVAAVADGADRGTPCPTRVVTLLGEGGTTAAATADLQSDRSDAVGVVTDLLACGRRSPTPGSDLLGSLLIAADRLEPELTSRQILLFSDGRQASDALALTPETLSRPEALDRAIAALDDQDLVSTRMVGSQLGITGPGAGSDLSATQRRGLTTFWTAYAARARVTLTVMK